MNGLIQTIHYRHRSSFARWEPATTTGPTAPYASTSCLFIWAVRFKWWIMARISAFCMIIRHAGTRPLTAV